MRRKFRFTHLLASNTLRYRLSAGALLVGFPFVNLKGTGREAKVKDRNQIA